MSPTNLDSPPPLLVVSPPRHVTHVYGFPGNREERWISGKMGGREERGGWLDARRRSFALLSLHILHHRLQHFIAGTSSSSSAHLFKSTAWGAAVVEASDLVLLLSLSILNWWMQEEDSRWWCLNSCSPQRPLSLRVFSRGKNTGCRQQARSLQEPQEIHFSGNITASFGLYLLCLLSALQTALQQQNQPNAFNFPWRNL